jgi:glycosyltransferase involved in cell wall biosynthesis
LIGATINSVLNQSLLPYEIIVIDDHSEDNPEQILKEYNKSIIFIRSKGNGPGAARNLGIEVSTGDYIQFFDSDDIMSSNKLKIQTSLLFNSAAGFVYCPFVKAIENEYGLWQQVDAVMQYNPVPCDRPLHEWVCRGWCPITQIALFKKELIRDIGKWNQDIFTHEDLEYWYRIGLHEPYPLHTRDCFVVYRQHKEQLTNNHTHKMVFAQNHLYSLSQIKEQIHYSYPLDTRLIFQAKSYSNLAFLKRNKMPYNPLNFDEICWLANPYYRIYNKLQRLQTGTMWEKMYGPLNDLNWLNSNKPDEFYHE